MNKEPSTNQYRNTIEPLTPGTCFSEQNRASTTMLGSWFEFDAGDMMHLASFQNMFVCNRWENSRQIGTAIVSDSHAERARYIHYLVIDRAYRHDHTERHGSKLASFICENAIENGMTSVQFVPCTYRAVRMLENLTGTPYAMESKASVDLSSIIFTAHGQTVRKAVTTA